MITEYVYKDRNSPNDVAFYEDGVLIDFTGATRVVVCFTGTAILADTDVDVALVDWVTPGSGVLRFNFTSLAVPVDFSGYATVTVEDAGHPLGQTLVAGADKALMFKFRESCH